MRLSPSTLYVKLSIGRLAKQTLSISFSDILVSSQSLKYMSRTPCRTSIQMLKKRKLVRLLKIFLGVNIRSTVSMPVPWLITTQLTEAWLHVVQTRSFKLKHVHPPTIIGAQWNLRSLLNHKKCPLFESIRGEIDSTEVVKSRDGDMLPYETPSPIPYSYLGLHSWPQLILYVLFFPFPFLFLLHPLLSTSQVLRGWKAGFMSVINGTRKPWARCSLS